MIKKVIDINCDMGEGYDENEARIMPFVSSVNVSCGWHAGSAEGIKQTIILAAKHRVLIGAHPSFKDKENFGRTEFITSPKEVYTLVYEQVKLLRKLVEACGQKLHHVKLHGALYNQTAKSFDLAKAAVKAVADVDKSLVFYGLAGSQHLEAAKALGLNAFSEVFADRTYEADGSLMARSKPNAVLKDPNDVLKQVKLMIGEAAVWAANGQKINLQVDTICIHGDGETAPLLAQLIYNLLVQNAS